MVQLGQVGELMVGATPGASGEGPAARYVRAGDILDSGNLAAPSDGAAPTRGRNTALAAGDVVVRGRGTPFAATVPQAVEGVYPTNDVLLFRPDATKADSSYIATFLNLPRTREI